MGRSNRQICSGEEIGGVCLIVILSSGKVLTSELDMVGSGTCSFCNGVSSALMDRCMPC